MKNTILSALLILWSVSLVFPQDENASGTSAGVGTVVINGETYNQIALRPEFPVGKKLKIALDLYFYFNDDGLYEGSWDFSDGNAANTLLDKIYYIKWGKPSDDLYFIVGALSSVTIGQGILVNNYSNTIQYPSIRRVGLDYNMKVANIDVQIVHSDFKQSKPGLIGTRMGYNLNDKISFGLGYATDLDQVQGLIDSDNDSTPDAFDDFPYDNEYYDQAVYDEEKTGYWSNVYQEITDEDGFDDWFEGSDIRNDYNQDNYNEDKISGFSLDAIYSMNKAISFYAQLAQLQGNKVILDSGEEEKLGWGFTFPGMVAKLWKFATFRAEYRQNSDHFMFNFWDQTYDLNRASVVEDNIITKRDLLKDQMAMRGYFLQLSAGISNLLEFDAGYQHLFPSNKDLDPTKSFLATLNINARKIPKLEKAVLFYQHNNTSDPFTESENLIHGYDLGVKVSNGVMLVYKGRTTYTTTDGNTFEPQKSVEVETQILF